MIYRRQKIRLILSFFCMFCIWISIYTWCYQKSKAGHKLSKFWIKLKLKRNAVTLSMPLKLDSHRFIISLDYGNLLFHRETLIFLRYIKSRREKKENGEGLWTQSQDTKSHLQRFVFNFVVFKNYIRPLRIPYSSWNYL